MAGSSIYQKSQSKLQRANLTTVPTLVESPFIILKIGDYTFGMAQKGKVVNSNGLVFKIQYPNYMQSLSVTKIDGQVNSYTIKMVYPITPEDDPNFMDKVFSGVTSDRMVSIQYGDWSAPMYIYKEDNALIQEVSSDIDFSAPKITYTIKCLGTGYGATVDKKSWGPKTGKPSDIIKGLVKDQSTGLAEVFQGMRNMNEVVSNNWIATNDKVVNIPSPQETLSPLDYLTYLSKYMADSSGDSSKYSLVVCDDDNSLYGGPYFKIVEVFGSGAVTDSVDTFEVNIGFPDNVKVASFKIRDNETYALLHEYSGNLTNANTYTYRINTHGELVKEFSPIYTRSESLLKTTQADSNWFQEVSQYPIEATMVIKGLIRPAILMSYVRVNTLFYGKKHNTSGLYVITKQVDTVNFDGYKTTLDLLRIQGDSKFGDGGFAGGGSGGGGGRSW